MRNILFCVCVLMGAFLGSLAITALASPAANDFVPVGTIIAWGGDAKSVPANWMLCNGKALKRKQYPQLFDAIGTAWGAPNNTKFNLPDLRGRFIRGADLGSGRDPDADDRDEANKGGSKSGVGSMQGDVLQDHSHEQDAHEHDFKSLYSGSYKIQAGLPDSGYYTIITSHAYLTNQTDTTKIYIRGVKKFGTKADVKKGEETRPTNAAVNFIIKVK